MNTKKPMMLSSCRIKSPQHTFRWRESHEIHPSYHNGCVKIETYLELGKSVGTPTKCPNVLRDATRTPTDALAKINATTGDQESA